MSFFDMLGMFDPGDGPRGPRRDSGATDDDPVIVDVQADGDDHGETPSAGKVEPPKRGVPRLTPRPLPNGPSKGTKILIGVVLALVVVVGLFFGLSQFITDLMWYGQLGFQNVVWTQLGVKFGLWAAYALLMAWSAMCPLGWLSALAPIRPTARRSASRMTSSKWASRSVPRPRVAPPWSCRWSWA